MTFDPEVANSNGYFKDPATKQLLTGNEKRVIQCAIEGSGKLIWPQVQFSDGSVGKIVYKLWTAEEKAIYRQYRELGKQRIKPVPVKQEPPAVPVIKEEHTVSVIKEEHTVPVIKEEHTQPQVKVGEGVASANMLAYIRNCDTHMGVWIMDGIIHDLLTVKGSKSYTPIARCLIPKEDRERLGIS